MSKRVAIFDMDGTIIDSMGKWGTVVYDYLDDLGLALEDGYLDPIADLSMEGILEALYAQGKLPYNPEEAFNHILEIMDDFYKNSSNLKPGVLNALEKMRKQNIPMAVATATRNTVAMSALKKHNLDDYFKFVQSCDTVNLTKDKCEYWNIASSKLDSNIENAIVFEDALYAIETVSNLGGDIVAIADDSAIRDKEKIKKLSTQYIESYDDLDFSLFTLN